MFDFFSELIQFLSQIAAVWNWFMAGIHSVLDFFSFFFGQFQPVLAGSPPDFIAILMFILASILFDFIRGRG